MKQRAEGTFNVDQEAVERAVDGFKYSQGTKELVELVESSQLEGKYQYLRAVLKDWGSEVAEGKEYEDKDKSQCFIWFDKVWH